MSQHPPPWVSPQVKTIKESAPSWPGLSLELEDARIDRAVILGLLSEETGELLKASVRLRQMPAEPILRASPLPYSIVPEEAARWLSLVKVLAENPYAEVE